MLHIVFQVLPPGLTRGRENSEFFKVLKLKQRENFKIFPRFRVRIFSDHLFLHTFQYILLGLFPCSFPTSRFPVALRHFRGVEVPSFFFFILLHIFHIFPQIFPSHITEGEGGDNTRILSSPRDYVEEEANFSKSQSLYIIVGVFLHIFHIFLHIFSKCYLLHSPRVIFPIPRVEGGWWYADL